MKQLNVGFAFILKHPTVKHIDCPEPPITEKYDLYAQEQINLENLR